MKKQTLPVLLTGFSQGGEHPWYVVYQGFIYLGWGRKNGGYNGIAPFLVSLEDIHNWNEFYIVEATPERLAFLEMQHVENNYAGIKWAMFHESTCADMIAYCERIAEEEQMNSL